MARYFSTAVATRSKWFQRKPRGGSVSMISQTRSNVRRYSLLTGRQELMQQFFGHRNRQVHNSKCRRPSGARIDGGKNPAATSSGKTNPVACFADLTNLKDSQRIGGIRHSAGVTGFTSLECIFRHDLLTHVWRYNTFHKNLHLGLAPAAFTIHKRSMFGRIYVQMDHLV